MVSQTFHPNFLHCKLFFQPVRELSEFFNLPGKGGFNKVRGQAFYSRQSSLDSKPLELIQCDSG